MVRGDSSPPLPPLSPGVGGKGCTLRPPSSFPFPPPPPPPPAAVAPPSSIEPSLLPSPPWRRPRRRALRAVVDGGRSCPLSFSSAPMLPSLSSLTAWGPSLGSDADADSSSSCDSGGGGGGCCCPSWPLLAAAPPSMNAEKFGIGKRGPSSRQPSALSCYGVGVESMECTSTKSQNPNRSINQTDA